jgi:hypothetical protein
MRLNAIRMVAALTFVASAASAHAFVYDETVSADLSGDGLNPTILSATPGINSLVMTSGVDDRDYFTFTVPTGYLLSSIFHKSYDSLDETSFIALQSGSTITEPPRGANAGNLLGYLHFGASTLGTEIIDDLAASGSSAPAAIGFTPPLSSGSYAFWVQQTGLPTQYALDFSLTAVPEPEQWMLLLGGALMLALRMRRKLVS